MDTDIKVWERLSISGKSSFLPFFMCCITISTHEILIMGGETEDSASDAENKSCLQVRVLDIKSLILRLTALKLERTDFFYFNQHVSYNGKYFALGC